MTVPPPPPPPHGSHTNGGGPAGATGANAKSGLPDGPYDIFIVPPHSSGGGFIYFPSLQTNRNSFLAGVACTLVVWMVWSVILPAFRNFMSDILAGNGFAGIILLVAAGAGGWAWGQTQTDLPGVSSKANPASTGAAGNADSSKVPPAWQRNTNSHDTSGANSTSGAAKGGWEKAREETRRKEDERRRTEDARKKREADERERIWQREKDAREREARERRERGEGAGSAAGSRSASPNKNNHQHPTAKTATDDASSYSFRPYDNPTPERPAHKATSASSIYSESSYAPSQSTSRTTPPPAHRPPYKTKDPDKIVIKGVYAFNNAFSKTPLAKLVSGVGSVTDGLILRITTEGLFIDDDVRSVPQREWDVKAWTLKLVESSEYQGMHVLRASIRDAEGKRYVVVLQEEEGWKVAVGLQRLRRGSQVRALGVSGLPLNETKAILSSMGWI